MKDPIPLLPYQVADLSFYMRHNRCLNLSDPGTRKTGSVCVHEFWRWRDHQAKSAWIMPKSIWEKNRVELLRFTPFEPDDVCILDGTPKQIQRKLNGPAKVFICGFTRFARIHEQLPSDVKGVDVDEVHEGYGGNDSQRTQAFYKAMKRMIWFIGMTGTLINGRLDTAYPAIHVIEPRYYPDFDSFMRYHEWTDGMGNRLGWKNPEKLSQIFARHAIRRTFEQTYGSEAKVIETERIEMAPRQREMYDQFDKDALIELEHAFITGSLPGVNFTRARQIMEHPNEFPDPANPGQFLNLIGNEMPGKEQRIDLHLANHVRTGKPIVIFSVYRRQQERILELMQRRGMTCALMNGETSAKERAAIDEGFCAGEIQGLSVSPKTAQVGWNWQFWGQQEVDHIIFASMDPLDTSFLQAYRRFIRGERKVPLWISVLEYIKSLDQRVMGLIHEKSQMANLVDATREVYKLSA